MIARLTICLHIACITVCFSGCSTSTASDQKTTVRKLPIHINSIGMRLVRLPGNTFLMGDKSIPDARPVHQVKLSPFWIGQFEVTNKEYELFKKQVRPQASLKNQQPVIDLAWQDAADFCRWLSKKENRNYRLLTEAEWEYAARGGLSQRPYPWGYGEPKGRATVGQLTTTSVGSYAPNGFRLYDMAGNAFEWVSDWYGEDYYIRSPLVNPKGPTKSYWVAKPKSNDRWKILRGGSYIDYEVDSAQRWPWPLSEKPYGTGFRVAMD